MTISTVIGNALKEKLSIRKNNIRDQDSLPYVETPVKKTLQWK